MTHATTGAFSVFLMIRFRLIKRHGFLNFCNDRFCVFGLQLLAKMFGNYSLLIGLVKNSRAILRADIWPLSIELRRVVQTKKMARKRFVAHFFWVKFDQHGLGMPGCVGANHFVCRIWNIATGIAHRGTLDPWYLVKIELYAPKTSCCKNCCFHTSSITHASSCKIYYVIVN